MLAVLLDSLFVLFDYLVKLLILFYSDLVIWFYLIFDKVWFLAFVFSFTRTESLEFLFIFTIFCTIVVFFLDTNFGFSVKFSTFLLIFFFLICYVWFFLVSICFELFLYTFKSTLFVMFLLIESFKVEFFDSDVKFCFDTYKVLFKA